LVLVLKGGRSTGKKQKHWLSQGEYFCRRPLTLRKLNANVLGGGGKKVKGEKSVCTSSSPLQEPVRKTEKLGTQAFGTEGLSRFGDTPGAKKDARYSKREKEEKEREKRTLPEKRGTCVVPI